MTLEYTAQGKGGREGAEHSGRERVEVCCGEAHLSSLSQARPSTEPIAADLHCACHSHGVAGCCDRALWTRLHSLSVDTRDGTTHRSRRDQRSRLHGVTLPQMRGFSPEWLSAQAGDGTSMCC